MRFLTLFAIMLLSISCSDEFDPWADSRNLPVIYSLFDLDDSIWDIRIERSFGGNEPALVSSKKYDSLYYKNLHAYIELRHSPTYDRYVYNPDTSLSYGGDLIAKHELVPEYSLIKDSGSFCSNPNVVYRVKKTDFDILKYVDFYAGRFYYTNGKSYLLTLCLEIKDSVSNNSVYSVATTPLIDRPNVLNPKNSMMIGLFSEQEINLEWQDHGWLYYPYIIFRYQEYNDMGWTNKSLLISLSQVNRYSRFFVSEYFYTYSCYPFNSDLLRKIGTKIKDENNIVARRFTSMDLIVRATDPLFDEYLDTYMNSMDYSVQSISNVINGYGFFGCVSNTRLEGFKLDIKSIDSLCDGIYTKHLHFVRW